MAQRSGWTRRSMNWPCAACWRYCADDQLAIWCTRVAGLRPDRYAQGHRWFGNARAAGAFGGSIRWRIVCVSWQTWWAGQAALVRWAGHVPVQQAAREGTLRLACDRDRAGVADPGATVDAAGGDRLAHAAARAPS